MENNGRLQNFFSSALKDHLIQGILIFASVFLAFWLNDLRQDRIEADNAKDVMKAVVSELERNMEVLEDWVPYHKSLKKQLEDIVNGGPEGLTQFDVTNLIAERGIFRDILTYDSWDYLRQSNPKIPIEDRMLINRLFRQQEYVDKAIVQSVDFLSTREVLDPDLVFDNYILFLGFISDLYYQEYFFINALRNGLDQLER